MPLLHRGGSILPLRERVRRSAELGWQDPFTLVVSLNKQKSGSDSQVRAEGLLYLDDGQTFAYEKGDFIWRRFQFTSSKDGNHSLKSSDEHSSRANGDSFAESSTDLVSYDPSNNGFAKDIHEVRVERVVVLGLEKSPKEVKVGGKAIEFIWLGGKSASGGKNGKSSELILKDPKVRVSSDWIIEIA